MNTPAEPIAESAVATGFVRIVSVPAGEAPLWVREKWVGLVLPWRPGGTGRLRP